MIKPALGSLRVGLILNKLMYKSLGTQGFLLKVLGQDVDTADDEGLGKSYVQESNAQGAWYLLCRSRSWEFGIVYSRTRSFGRRHRLCDR